MSDIKITDLVDQETIDKIKELNSELQNLLTSYSATAKDLARGLNIEVKVVGDIDKLEKVLVDKSREAAVVTERLNDLLAQQGQVIANTTNTISRELMYRERLNKTQREEYRDGEKVRNMVEDLCSSYEDHVHMLAKYDLQIKANKKAQQDLEKQYKNNLITQDQYLERQAKLLARSRELALDKSQLTQLMKIEEKLASDNAGSYNHLSHQLELLKKTYKDMTDEQKESDIGRDFERTIQDLDAHLKDLAADMGEFQRNVGNYAIAGQNGVVATESVIAAISREAVTMQDLIDQTKILEEARAMLDKSDGEYTSTLEAINTAIEENKRKLSDVSDIIDKDATSVAEAEAQNKRFAEALRYVDLTTDGANDLIALYNARIAANTALIEEANGAADVFTRTIGNFTISGNAGIVTIESINSVLAQQAVTTQDLVDQIKILEEAKARLDQTDERYAETLGAIEARQVSLRTQLTDVSDILGIQCKTVSEAEEQNKRLSEALRHIDVTAEGAAEQMQAIRDQIEANTEMIDKATGTNEEYAESILKMVGINIDFGSSLDSLSNNNAGGFIDGLNTKIKAFSKTLWGLMTSPWMLTLLSITGAVAVFKFWYNYNKGIEEATKLTKNYAESADTTADDIRHLRSEIMAMADFMEKDFDATIGGANTLVQQFGVSWEEAVEIMRKGIEAGADINGNLLDNIEQFAPAFKDAGLSAQEFMSLLAQTRNGIFDERALKSISDAAGRIRNMTDKTKNALESVGISADKMQRDLKEGNITMLEAIQQVTDKMKELPPNCQEVGSVMTNVFGRKSVKAGEELLESISDIDGSLDELVEQMGAYGEIAREEMEAQTNLQEALAALFDQTGGNFEIMTSKAKTFAIDALAKIIRKVAEIANWFVELYNRSQNVREGVAFIGVAFESLWETAKFVINFIIEGWKAVAEAADAALNLDWSGVVSACEKGFNIIANKGVSAYDKIKKSAAEAHAMAKTNQLKPVGIAPSGALKQGNGSGADEEYKDPTGLGSGTDSKEAEKRAKEELKRLQELEESKLAIMEEGHDKELALIRFKFKKKLDEITGNSTTEQVLRIQLAIQCDKEIADCELKYQTELAKLNLVNRIAAVKKGSKEELDLRLTQIEMTRLAEIEEARKTGAEVKLINEKYNRQRIDLEEEYANVRAQKIQEEYSVEEIALNRSYSNRINAVKEQYAKELALASGNSVKQEELKRKLEEDLFKIETEYSKESGEAAIKMIKSILALDKMSVEDRLKWERELANAEIELNNKVADAEAEAADKKKEADNRLLERRKANLQSWLNTASDVIGNISSLINTLYDGRIQRIEEAQEVNTAAGEKEQARVEELVEKKVITQEEGEARKRAAEALTARKNEELEKRKAALQYKAAVFQKATDLAQAGIATALAITQALPNLVLAAIAGAMGAVQIATILATPIPKYAKGTDYHKGGPAIVGDAGRHELIIYRQSAWLTPDRPTLVDIPAGAMVLPSINDVDITNSGLTVLPDISVAAPSVVVNNDYKKLERELVEVANLIRLQTKQQRSIASLKEYELFKLRII